MQIFYILKIEVKFLPTYKTNMVMQIKIEMIVDIISN